MCVTGCGNFGLVGYGCGRIDKFNMQSGAHRGTFWAQPPIGHAGGIHGVEVTALNEMVISASFDGSVKLWDFEERRLLHTFETGSPVTQMQLNRDNSLLAVCCDDLKMRVYDVSSRRLVREFEGHTNCITDVCLSSDGRWALTASADRSLRIYDIPTARLIDWVSVGPPLASLYLSALLFRPLATLLLRMATPLATLLFLPRITRLNNLFSLVVRCALADVTDVCACMCMYVHVCAVRSASTELLPVWPCRPRVTLCAPRMPARWASTCGLTARTSPMSSLDTRLPPILLVLLLFPLPLAPSLFLSFFPPFLSFACLPLFYALSSHFHVALVTLNPS